MSDDREHLNHPAVVNAHADVCGHPFEGYRPTIADRVREAREQRFPPAVTELSGLLVRRLRERQESEPTLADWLADKIEAGALDQGWKQGRPLPPALKEANQRNWVQAIAVFKEHFEKQPRGRWGSPLERAVEEVASLVNRGATSIREAWAKYGPKH